MDDEAAVFAFVRKRDPALFDLLVERYQHRVFRLVVSLLGPYADLDAEEVTQEVFLRAYRRLETFRGESRFSTWLYRLAYNRTLEYRRRARIRMPHVPVETVQSIADTPAEQHDHEREQLVAVLLEQLPDVYRTVINMYYWLDCSVEEIAETLAVPPGTVKSYLFRARRRLREHAVRLGVEWPE